jgi:hypothetical protein
MMSAIHQGLRVSRLGALAACLALAPIAVSVPARADTSCKQQATDKKLAGAAMTSFMTKCEKDAGAVCTTQASDKKLNGAAKTSFVKKCTSDAVGT